MVLYLLMVLIAFTLHITLQLLKLRKTDFECCLSITEGSIKLWQCRLHLHGAPPLVSGAPICTIFWLRA